MKSGVAISVLCFITFVNSYSIRNKRNANVQDLINELRSLDGNQLVRNYLERYPESNRVRMEDPDVPMYEVDRSYPSADVHTGSLAGIAVNQDGNPWVFDRVDRLFDEDTFDSNNVYAHQEEGPIKQNPIRLLDSETGKELDSFGKDIFYLPHSLTIDHEGNYWTTDAGLHQVHKFDSNKNLVLTVGEKLVPAQNDDDKQRLCKPTDVAVTTNGDFFVSDGYCNHRVVKYNANGEYIGQFGGDYETPHSLALIESEDVICVADRENMRIVCVSAGINDPSTLGDIVRIYDEEAVGTVYAITYDHTNNLLLGVTIGINKEPRVGFTIDPTIPEGQSAVISVWGPEEWFYIPHSIDISKDGQTVFVAEVQTRYKNLWKLNKN